MAHQGLIAGSVQALENTKRSAHMGYCKIPVSIKFLIEPAAAVPIHRYI